MFTVTKRLLAENCLLNNYPMLVSCSRSQRTRYRQITPNTKQFKAPFHNITSSDAHQLTAVLVDIVNDRDQYKTNKMFYQQLHNSQENKPDDEVEELFRLRARSAEDQPGNVYVFLRPRKLKTFKTSGKIYSVLNDKLEALYEKDKQNNNARFAQWISRLYSRTTQR